MKRSYLSFFPMQAVFCAALLLAPMGQLLLAQQPPELPPPSQALTPDQLDDLVAPVALYPDPLVSQILVASTYPLELVQALQWLQRNPGLQGAALTQAARAAELGPEHTGLGVFPDLVKRLNQDITWTTNLGNAFLGQQGRRDGRRTAHAAQGAAGGKLSSTSQQTVTTTNDNGQPEIMIQPANPQMIYLPNYDPAYFWGPPLYYPYASWFYPPYGGGAYFGFGMGIPMGLYFGGGWGGWGGWGWGFGWGGHSIIVNNSFIHRYNFNSGRGGSLNGRSAWSHDASHRQGVPYSNSAVSSRYGGNVRQNLQSRAPLRGAIARNCQAQSRAAPPPNPEPSEWAIGRVSRSAPNQNRSAFGGVREGSAARTQSDHGYSSLGPARSSGGSAPRGGGAAPSRGGGGGGGGGNGGGGHR
jgi:hypothetical protein